MASTHSRQHRADAVIGLGGGAALDVAKAIALMAVHPATCSNMPGITPACARSSVSCPTSSRCRRPPAPGSEVGRSSVISDDATHIKKIIFSPKLLAKAVFADPELTLDLPPAITAATGMDALTHNVESYLSPAYHPLCDGIALEGVRIAARSLRTAVREPHNLQARSDMLMSSMMGAIAFQKDLGAVHSCAHALSTVADLHHGLANGIMIDHVMRFNLEERRRQDGRARARRRRRCRRRAARGQRRSVHRLAGGAQARSRHSGDAVRALRRGVR